MRRKTGPSLRPPGPFDVSFPHCLFYVMFLAVPFVGPSWRGGSNCEPYNPGWVNEPPPLLARREEDRSALASPGGLGSPKAFSRELSTFLSSVWGGPHASLGPLMPPKPAFDDGRVQNPES